MTDTVKFKESSNNVHEFFRFAEWWLNLWFLMWWVISNLPRRKNPTYFYKWKKKKKWIHWKTLTIVRYSHDELEKSLANYLKFFIFLWILCSNDYQGIEMVVQFGYITLFSAAFPFAAFLGFIADIIESKSDAFKMCFALQVYHFDWILFEFWTAETCCKECFFDWNLVGDLRWLESTGNSDKLCYFWVHF